jgi:hypothetical protein
VVLCCGGGWFGVGWWLRVVCCLVVFVVVEGCVWFLVWGVVVVCVCGGCRVVVCV